MIRHIFFDLGNVLVPLDWNIAFNRLRPYLEAHNPRSSYRTLADVKTVLAQPSVALETGKLEFDQYYEIAKNLLGIRISKDEFQDIWCCIFSVDDNMVALGRALLKKYDVWLASNTSRVHYEYILKMFPQVAFYKGAALSFELGVMKPALAYYKKALAKFGIPAKQAVFIDDLEENVEGAIKAGLMGIVFQDRQQLVKDLRSLGINVDATG